MIFRGVLGFELASVAAKNQDAGSHRQELENKRVRERKLGSDKAGAPVPQGVFVKAVGLGKGKQGRGFQWGGDKRSNGTQLTEAIGRHIVTD